MPSHLDRLTSIDAAFLAQERSGSHMHIGGILLTRCSAARALEVPSGL
jgi:hypothetical protein